MNKSTPNSSVKKTTKGAATGRAVAVDWTRVATIGIDVGDRFSSYCAIDASGTIVAEGRITTTVGAIELELGQISRKTVAIEAGMHSPWMSRLLNRLGMR